MSIRARKWMEGAVAIGAMVMLFANAVRAQAVTESPDMTESLIKYLAQQGGLSLVAAGAIWLLIREITRAAEDSKATALRHAEEKAALLREVIAIRDAQLSKQAAELQTLIATHTETAKAMAHLTDSINSTLRQRGE